MLRLFEETPIYIIVGCDVVAHVISAGVLSDTYRGKQCELFTKKGGITSSFVLFGLWPERTFLLHK